MIAPENEHLTLRIGRKTTVTLMFEGPLTQEEIQRLLKLLDEMADTYPSAEEQQTEERMGGTIQWQKPNAG